MVFVCLYITATLLYPGGSQLDKNAEGFSWSQNYWCNLLHEYSINGRYNTGRPFAMSGMFVIAVTLVFFFLAFPIHAGLSRTKTIILRVAGVLSMLTGLLIFTRLHDVIINVSGFFGLVALTGVFFGLYQLQWMRLFWFGIFNLLLIILNNILYYGDGLLEYLPVVQKITFFSFLVWICLISISLYQRKMKTSP